MTENSMWGEWLLVVRNHDPSKPEYWFYISTMPAMMTMFSLGTEETPKMVGGSLGTSHS